MNRIQLINFICEYSKDEFTNINEVFELAKENENQLRDRVKNIANYLANKYD